MKTGPIQTLPRGLLSLMQLKNLGRNPRDVEDWVQPVIPVDDYWKQGLLTTDPDTHSTTPLNNAAGSFGFSTGQLIVPEDECWWVEWFSLEVTVAAGAAERIQDAQPLLFLKRSATVRYTVLTETRVTVNGTAGNGATAAIVAKNFWAPPGSEFGYYVGLVTTAGTPNVAGTFRYARLQV